MAKGVVMTGCTISGGVGRSIELTAAHARSAWYRRLSRFCERLTGKHLTSVHELQVRGNIIESSQDQIPAAIAQGIECL